MDSETPSATGEKPLTADARHSSREIRVRPRLWPAVLVIALQLTVMIGSSWLVPETPIHLYGLMFAPLVGTGLFVLWWLFASRVPWLDRVLGLLIVGAAASGCAFLVDESVSITLIVYGLTSLTLTGTIVLAVTAAFGWSRCRWLVLFCVLALSIFWTTLRIDGLDGSFVPDFAFRWSPTPEEEFLASPGVNAPSSGGALIPVPVVSRLEVTAADWPGFRGTRRDGKVRGVTFRTNWDAQPPRELWRRKVGPGWSSFAVVGICAFTQEQRGEEELVVCYGVDDGQEIWTNRVTTRFTETIGGPGPRGTPTFDDGRLYTLGATGVLQCLDANTGEAVWVRRLPEDTGAEIPTWGFSSSPLVRAGLVAVFAGAENGKSVVAYDRNSGELRWSGGDGKLSYSSCHAAQIAGVDQVLILTEVGLQSLDPAMGTLLWEHRWEIKEMQRIVQPLVLPDQSVLIGTGLGFGTRRVAVRRTGGQWVVEESWTSRYLKPYFNDFVDHGGHCYGFDARFLACIDSRDGERRWKGGRYGHGQLLLIVDMDLLLVISERGELVLVEADPAEHREVARFQALEGKTWNHPVIAQGKLFVRNGNEAACFELPR